MHGDSNERVHDTERRHDNDKKEEEKHHRPLEPHRFEELVIHVDPSLGILGRLEKFLDLLLYPFRAVRIDGSHGDAVKCITEPIQFLPDVNRHEKKLRVMQVMPGLEDAGYGQLLRQHDLAQFIDRLAFLVALRFLELFHSVENFAEVTGRIDR